MSLGSLGFIFGLMNRALDLQNLLLSDRGQGYPPDRAKFSNKLDRVRILIPRLLNHDR
jgi:hypothetical protein